MARVIAIDGPAAAGKSTVGRRVAEELGSFYFDTGLLYRAATWQALRQGMPVDDGPALAKIIDTTAIEVRPASVGDGRLADVWVDGQDVSWQVRRPEVDRHVSAVAAHPEVRAALVEVQRAVAHRQPTVMAGRDIGTVIFPEACLKIFLTASPEERARRRLAETQPEAGAEAFQAVLEALQARDELDRSREVAPLRKAPDAIEIDTDRLSIDEVVQRIVALARARACGGQ
ncbi:MAG: (d)CMP kinase [Chloroflexi bacterium]|nr:(d)CMP kinase [Chloroflexota bacterium]